MNQSFHMWTPIIVKGNGDDKEMIIGGLASTTSRDEDGEILDPSGFDVSYFLDHGFLNWNHQTAKDPSAYIGRPTKAVITKNGLEIEGKLFGQSEKAKQVYELAKTMQSEGLSLGFSIEGKALERDQNDPRKVLKARITGMAITPNPKNKDATMTIIKGHNLNKLSAYEDADEEETQKAMSAGSASGQAISKESLRGELTVTEFTDEGVEKGCKKLSKGEVYDRLIERYPSATGDSLNRMYSFIVEQQKIITMNTENDNVDVQPSEDALEKAMTVIDELSKGEGSSSIDSEENDDLTKGNMKKSSMKKSSMKKSEEEEEDEEDDDEEEEEDDDMSKGITPEHIEAAASILENAGWSVSREDNSITKGIQDDLNDKEDSEIADLIKGLSTDLKKSIINELGTELKGVHAAAVLIKGMKADMSAMQEQIETLGKNNNGPRSVTAQPVERTFGNPDLAKGNPGGEGGEEAKTLHISQKKAITDILEKGYWSDDNGGEIINPQLAKDTQIFEVSGQLSKGIVDELGKQGYQLVK